ncbi:MAG: adenosine deaminase [Acidobacteria bacterium]|nr:adenosine deaminase [Acidobacteriota bacterium]
MPYSNLYARSIALVCLLTGAAAAQDFASRFAEIRDRATPAQLYAFLQTLPKGGDLHHHATLSFYAHHVLEAAVNVQKLGYRYYTRTSFHPCPDSENGPIVLFSNIGAPAVAKLSACRQTDYTPLDALNAEQKKAWLSAHILDEPGENRNEFFEEIVVRLTPLSRNPHLFAELFAQNLKLFGAEGLRYVEAQWGPFLNEKPDGSGYSPDEAIAIVQARLKQPDVVATGVAYRFQVTIIRFRADIEQQILNLHEFVDRHRDLFVGINAAGREDNDKGYALRMLKYFRQARRRTGNIPLSIHAGEKDSPGPEVRNTLLLGATRIGHGVNLIDDPDTMLLMRHNRYLVEINLISNRLLDYVPNLIEHPFPEYLRFGIPVCLNTDDRGSWDSNMTDEYMHAVKLFRLSWDEVKTLGRNSLSYSFAQAELKQSMLASYEKALQDFEKRFDSADWAKALDAIQPATSGYARRNLLN